MYDTTSVNAVVHILLSFSYSGFEISTKIVFFFGLPTSCLIVMKDQ